MTSIKEIEGNIIVLNDIHLIIDRDVARLYGVETKRVNEAVSNNPDKFPEGYIIQIEKNEWDSLRSKFSTLKGDGRGKHTKYPPKAFSEKGLYMLATILKSPKATATTIAIIETFTKIRVLTRTLNDISTEKDKKMQKKLLQKGGEIFTELLDDDLQINETETSIELNFAMLKIKHKVKRKKGGSEQ